MNQPPSVRVALYVASLATVTGGLSAATPITAAQAADGYRINARPERVVVNQSYENIRWSVRNDGCLTDADANLEHVRSRNQADFDYDSRPGNGLNGTLRLYNFERMGRYAVYGEGWNDCLGEFGDTSTLATDHIVVKRAARVMLDGNRHHRRFVTLQAKVRKYAGGYPIWRSSRHAMVTFQRKISDGWKRIRRDSTNRRGIAAVTFRTRTRARYRAVVGPSATVWGDASNHIRR
jgi:hypothetical protein